MPIWAQAGTRPASWCIAEQAGKILVINNLVLSTFVNMCLDWSDWPRLMWPISHSPQQKHTKKIKKGHRTGHAKGTIAPIYLVGSPVMAPSSSPWRCVVLAILAWVSCPAFPAFAPRTRTQRQVLNRPWIPWQGTLSSPQDRGVNVAPQRDAWEEFMAAMVGAPDGPSLLSQSAANMHCMHQNMFWWVIHVWHAILHNQSQGPKRR